MRPGSVRGPLAFGLWVIAVGIGMSAPLLRTGDAVPLITGLLASSGALAMVSLNGVVDRRQPRWRKATRQRTVGPKTRLWP